MSHGWRPASIGQMMRLAHICRLLSQSQWTSPSTNSSSRPPVILSQEYPRAEHSRISLPREKLWIWTAFRMLIRAQTWGGDYSGGGNDFGLHYLYLTEGTVGIQSWRWSELIWSRSVCLARGRSFTVPVTPIIEHCDNWNRCSISDVWDGSIVSSAVLRRDLVGTLLC